MARRAARWFWDHKRLVVGTSFAAAGAYTGYVLWQKKRELDALCEELMSTQGPLARNEESRAREHFEVTQQEVRAVLGREMPRVHAQLKRLLDTEALTVELRSGQKFDQAQWNGLKLMMWTRLLSSVYALALLELKLRIHINIVARHYLHETSAAQAAGGTAAVGAADGGGGGGAVRAELSKVTKLRFLCSESLCTDGFEPLVRAVRAAVETELAAVSLDQNLTTEQLADVLTSIRAHLESAPAAGCPGEDAPASAVRAFLLEAIDAHDTHDLLPPHDAHGAAAEPEHSQLGGLHAEVREILQSTPYHVMLADVLAAAHAALHELLRQKLDTGAAEGAGVLPAGTPVAKLLPRMAKLLPTITAEDFGANPISVAIAKVPALNEFSWMVFTSGPLFAAPN